MTQLFLGDNHVGRETMRKVSECEQHAAECRQMAARVKNPQLKKELEHMAEVIVETNPYQTSD